MVLVVVTESIVEVHISLEVLRQVEGKAAGARLHEVLFDVLRTCDVLIIFVAVCVVYYMLFDLELQKKYILRALKSKNFCCFLSLILKI